MMLRKTKESETEPVRYYAWMENGRPHYSTKTHAARLPEAQAQTVVRHLKELGFEEPEIIPDV